MAVGTSPLIAVLLPGALLVVLGGALVDVARTLGGSIAAVGLMLLVTWPLFNVIVDVNCSRRRRRGQSVGPGLVRIERVVHLIRAVTVLVVLPVALLGGLGIYCLLTASDDPDTQNVKYIVAIGSFVLMAASLLFVGRGRTPLVLRVTGIGLAVFGAGGLGAVWLVLAEGFTSVGDGVMLVGSIVLIGAGTWLAATGRNTARRS